MSVALWKTILRLAQAGAALLILGSGFLFWGQRADMGRAWAAPDFQPRPVPRPTVVADTKDLSIALGRFQREKPREEAKPAPVEQHDILTELAKYGEIIGAIVVPPPYVEGGDAPAIVFRLRQKGPDGNDVRTIRMGEALVEKPLGPLTGIPQQYQFIACERDPENPKFVYFVFDMKCDGTDIQKIRWKPEEPAKEQAKVEGAAPPTGPAPVSTDKMYVGDRLTSHPPPEPRPSEGVQPVVPPPVPEPRKVVQDEPRGTLFEEEDGIFAPTADGVDYLEKNYEKILEETRTESYRDAEGRSGVRVVGISNASVANQFGIRKDDVILRINGIPVGSQSEAVNVVKSELKKKVKIIRVTIRRAGREMEKSFDTRDPATRRAAKKTFGNR